MPIDIYGIRISPPCRAVMMTAKHLDIEYNLINIDLTTGENHGEDYKKINPDGKVPAINDNGFILNESRAIMAYLCNQYAPDSSLYPKDPKQRALVDRWLNFDISLFSKLRELLVVPKFMGIPVSDESLKTFNDTMKLLDQLIGDQKYLVGNGVTIADLSVLATNNALIVFGIDLTAYPNLKRWLTDLTEELPYFKEINEIDAQEVAEFVSKMKAMLAKKFVKTQ